MANTLKTLVDYDAKSDSLALSSPQKYSSRSVELGDIIIDFDAKNAVVGIELLNASALLKTLTRQEVSKSMLEQIKSASFVQKTVGSTIVVTFEIHLQTKTLANAIAVPLHAELAS
ncbi:DUF2283 domain-containing protein [Candidatus Woesearchaeota archaeon]|nr:DUF2283 domain-containing protein [Candidatus Woesearchaeota archaeon]